MGHFHEEFNPFEEHDAKRNYEDLYLAEQPKHKSSLTHEGLAAAAGFAAMHAYEAHLRAMGQPVSHGKMKEILASIAAAEVDKLVETKGLDWVDRHKAKKLAEQQAHYLASQRYGEGNSGWEYAQGNAGSVQEYNYGGGAPYGAQGCGNYGWYDQRYGANCGGYGGGYEDGGCGCEGGGNGGGGYGGGRYAAPPAGPAQEHVDDFSGGSGYSIGYKDALGGYRESLGGYREALGGYREALGGYREALGGYYEAQRARGRGC